MKARLIGTMSALVASTAAVAQEGTATVSASASSAAYWAAGIAIGLSVAVATFSQSRAAVAALDGIARNPQAAKSMGTPLILSLALMEALGLLGFVIAFLLAGK
jgi:F-type H+-transporting ATPase subunit c